MYSIGATETPSGAYWGTLATCQKCNVKGAVRRACRMMTLVLPKPLPSRLTRPRDSRYLGFYTINEGERENTIRTRYVQSYRSRLMIRRSKRSVIGLVRRCSRVSQSGMGPQPVGNRVIGQVTPSPGHRWGQDEVAYSSDLVFAGFSAYFCILPSTW